ncbi:hypothetical protein FCH28_32845 [Streptomyces piniterrae]|uniref:Sortase n=1 Tax=Streptomyces piniterrae TaxID=2571125 RepID=A0A4U0MRX0_9ACTN|nr:hypothetical protein [Streptomyces piniterrae]TJZ43579.1 hypothetical protein FCH28_32845 [Streptomyces piniterrae]
MNAARITAAALLSTAVLGLAAPAASARVAPNPVTAGQEVNVSDGRHCAAAQGARAASTLFGGAVALRPDTRGMAAEATVDEGVTPGRYKVVIECGPGGARYTETVTVRGGSVDGVNTTQAAGGLALLVLAGGAAYLLRRTVSARF